MAAQAPAATTPTASPAGTQPLVQRQLHCLSSFPISSFELSVPNNWNNFIILILFMSIAVR
jgi:hypothetical protein